MLCVPSLPNATNSRLFPIMYVRRPTTVEIEVDIVGTDRIFHPERLLSWRLLFPSVASLMSKSIEDDVMGPFPAVIALRPFTSFSLFQFGKALNLPTYV